MTETGNNRNVSKPFTEEEQKSSKEAKDFFEEKNYEESNQRLKKLIKIHQSDPYLLHNRGVNEFYRTNKMKVGDLKKILTKVIKQVKNRQDEEDIIASDNKIGCSCAKYNLAMVYFQLHQFSASEELLVPLHVSSDNSDNRQQLRVDLLLADSYLMNHKPDEAEKILEKWRTMFIPDKTADDKAKVVAETSPAAVGFNLERPWHYLMCKCKLQLKQFKPFKSEIREFNKLFLNDNASTTEKQPPVKANADLKATAATPVTNNYATHALFLKSNSEYLVRN